MKVTAQALSEMREWKCFRLRQPDLNIRQYVGYGDIPGINSISKFVVHDKKFRSNTQVPELRFDCNRS